jgi:hypothetical protein
MQNGTAPFNYGTRRIRGSGGNMADGSEGVGPRIIRGSAGGMADGTAHFVYTP